MAASTSILADKLHEYPQQDVIDGTGGGSDSILDDCLNKKDGVLINNASGGLVDEVARHVNFGEGDEARVPAADVDEQLIADPAELDRLLALGAEKARAVAEPKVELVKVRVGFIPSIDG